MYRYIPLRGSAAACGLREACKLHARATDIARGRAPWRGVGVLNGSWPPAKRKTPAACPCSHFLPASAAQPQQAEALAAEALGGKTTFQFESGSLRYKAIGVDRGRFGSSERVKKPLLPRLLPAIAPALDSALANDMSGADSAPGGALRAEARCYSTCWPRPAAARGVSAAPMQPRPHTNTA